MDHVVGDVGCALARTPAPATWAPTPAARVEATASPSPTIAQTVTLLTCYDNYPDWTASLTLADGSTLDLATHESNCFFFGGPWQTTLNEQTYIMLSPDFIVALGEIWQTAERRTGALLRTSGSAPVYSNLTIDNKAEYTNMRVIITGGTGLIGSALVPRLLESGHEVIVLSRSPVKHKNDMPDAVKLYKWDARTAEGWGRLVNGETAIINLAGASIGGESFPPPRWTDARKKLIIQSRLYAGQAVVEAIRQAEEKPHTLIQSSAVGYYGVNNGDEIITEDHPPGDDFLSRVCIEWEQVTEPVEEIGVRHVILRTGIVLSMEEGALPRMVLPFRFFAGGPLGSGEQWYSWIHLEDEARAIHWLLENEEASGVYNLSAPNPIRQKDLAKIIGKEMGRPWFVPAPAFALKTALGEVATVVLDGQRAVPARLEDEGFTFEYTQAEEAIADLL